MCLLKTIVRRWRRNIILIQRNYILHEFSGATNKLTKAPPKLASAGASATTVPSGSTGAHTATRPIAHSVTHSATKPQAAAVPVKPVAQPSPPKPAQKVRICSLRKWPPFCLQFLQQLSLAPNAEMFEESVENSTKAAVHYTMVLYNLFDILRDFCEQLLHVHRNKQCNESRDKIKILNNNNHRNCQKISFEYSH